MFELDYAEGWDKYFVSLDSSVQARIWKKIQQLKTKEKSRHLEHGAPFFVEEAGQYRIAFKQNNQNKIKMIYFVGDHKQYDTWCSTL